jgi:hypothetical protein
MAKHMTGAIVFVGVLLAQPLFGQTKPAKDRPMLKSLEACNVELTEAGRKSRFSDTATAGNAADSRNAFWRRAVGVSADSPIHFGLGASGADGLGFDLTNST